MVVIVLSSCPASLKGDLSKWLFELDTGVYVGNPSKRVRENLWERIRSTLKRGRAIIAYSDRSEQGVKFDVLNSKWKPVDFDGIELMLHPVQTIESIQPVKTEEKVKPILKKPPEALLPNDYVVIDLETTGLDPGQDEITEIAALKVRDGEVIDDFECLIKIEGSIPEVVRDLTGITEDILKNNGWKESEALTELKEFIGELPVVGHNLNFDLGFIKNACLKDSVHIEINNVYDTMQLAKKKIIGIKSVKLKSLLEYFGLSGKVTHRAFEDCLNTQIVFEKLKKL